MKISDYPTATEATGADILGAQGGATKRFPIGLLGSGTPASQGEAEAGVNNAHYMTPLRVKQAIDALAPSGGGATNLTVTPHANKVTVNSDTGTDADIPLADGTNAGLITPAEKTKISDALTEVNLGLSVEGDSVTISSSAGDDVELPLASSSNAGLMSVDIYNTFAGLAALLETQLNYKGPLDCSANPNYPASQLGDVYVVTVAGKVGGSFGKLVRPRDVLLSLGDNSAGSEASVGVGWNISQGQITGLTNAGISMMTAVDADAQTALLNIGIGNVSGLQDTLDNHEGRISSLEGMSGSPGGGSISNPGVAYIRSDGNDSTGDGSANAPWATLQLAYIGGYKVMDIGVGTFAGITGTTLNLHLHGKGVGKTIVGNITGTSGDVTGNGRTMITVGDITIQPPNADPGSNGMSEGDPGSNGNPGTAASAVTVRGLTASTISLIGGSAGAGGHGANNSSSGGFGGGGGTGGDGGAGNTLTIVGCETSGIVTSRGGSPGNGGAAGSSTSGGPGYGGSSGSGGNGGAPGALVIRDSIIGGYAHTPPISGGTPGSPGTGNDGNGSAGSNGSDASGGTVLLTLSSVASVGGFGETITPQGAVIAGAFYANTYP